MRDLNGSSFLLHSPSRFFLSQTIIILYHAYLVVKEFPSGTREQFLANCKNGEYDDVVVIYRSNVSTKYTGRFDKELVSALPKSVKYIVHNGAGYDNIDVPVVTEAGACPFDMTLLQYAYK